MNFHWYLIGYGDGEDQYRKLLRHEAWGLVVHEARVLHKLILISKFAGLDERIVNGETEYIVSIEDQDKFTERLEKFILTQEDRETRR